MHRTRTTEGRGAGPGEALDEKRFRKARELLKRLKEIGYQRWISFLSNLSRELRATSDSGSRDGTNATRLVNRQFQITDENGTETKARLPRYVVNRARTHALGPSTELILMDGTGSLTLNRLVFGDHVQEHHYSVERPGPVVQIANSTGSKFALLVGEHADRNRAKLGEIIRNLRTISGDS